MKCLCKITFENYYSFGEENLFGYLKYIVKVVKIFKYL